MPEIELWNWWMPARTPRGKEYLSAWKMTAQDAKLRGAIRPEPSTREVRSPSQDINGSFSHLGVGWDKGKQELK